MRWVIERSLLFVRVCELLLRFLHDLCSFMLLCRLSQLLGLFLQLLRLH